MTQRPFRVIVVDDHDMILDSFARAFSEADDFQIVKTLTSAAAVEQACVELHPDLLIMDVCTEGGASGLEALAAIKPNYPDIKVIMMSGFDEISYAPRARALGAQAFASKTNGFGFFVDIARSVMDGQVYFPEPKKIPLPSGEAPFTPRELEILRLLCASKSRTEIAETLMISEKTVKRHIENMREKTGYSSMVELIIYVLSNGWINPIY